MEITDKMLEWHLNSHGISNELLSDYLRNVGISRNFLGVFPYNELPPMLFVKSENDRILIINVGQHFVTLLVSPLFTLYVDSFGLAPRKNIKTILKKLKNPLFYNTKTIQGINSPFCGLYAALFCLHLDDAKFKLTFARSTEKNDELCISYLKLYHRTM